MTKDTPDELYAGRFLRVLRRGRWEYVSRANATGVVAVVAMHDDGRVVLVEQRREPVEGSVLELPAGLVGDTSDEETMIEAARRELLEETGYTASVWRWLGRASTSPGLTDEAIAFFLATGLSKGGPGGGVDGEAIRVHEVGLGELPGWLDRMNKCDVRMDMKMLAGLKLVEFFGKGGSDEGRRDQANQ